MDDIGTLQGQGHATTTSVFGNLTRCIRFDRKRFAKDVDIFERALEYTKNIVGNGDDGKGMSAMVVVFYIIRLVSRDCFFVKNCR
jgi:hypothetical protein